MNIHHARYFVVAFGLLVAACAHVPREPALDPSSGLNLAPLEARFSASRCQVSVPLSQLQVLSFAERDGVPHPESRSDWIALASNIRPGDQLREVNCQSYGKGRKSSGLFFYGLFRGGLLIGEMHTMILD